MIRVTKCKNGASDGKFCRLHGGKGGHSPYKARINRCNKWIDVLQEEKAEMMRKYDARIKEHQTMLDSLVECQISWWRQRRKDKAE